MEQQAIYLETRAAAGGDEASIWASDLMRMYTRFASRRGWNVTQLNRDVVKITGPGIFDLLKRESGVHRVQRVPQTERRGRIHTSTASVAVLPEIADSEVSINPQNLEWQFFHASSHGGQNVQKVATAVRLRHLPTGIVVSAQTERFQEQNRQIALSLLRAKLNEREELEKERTIAGYRSPIGRGMRAEKIRTYNYPQNRITDHRINKSWGNLEEVMNGNLDKVVELTKGFLEP